MGSTKKIGKLKTKKEERNLDILWKRHKYDTNIKMLAKYKTYNDFAYDIYSFSWY